MRTDYIPNGFEENVLEIIGLLQMGKSDKIIFAKEIAITIYKEYNQSDIISIHNVLRKLKLNGLVKKTSTNNNREYVESKIKESVASNSLLDAWIYSNQNSK